MSPPVDLLEVAGILADLFERLKAPYAIGGAIAQNFWGVIRATQDVDLLVSLPRIRFEELRGALAGAGFASLDTNCAPRPGIEVLRFPYSANGRPMLPLDLALGR